MRSYCADITSRRQQVLDQTVSTHGKSLVHPKGELIPISADVTDKSSIEQLVTEISKRESHVDLLVNNAGITGSISTVEKGDEDAVELSKELWDEKVSDWEDIYRTNAIGYVPYLHAGHLFNSSHAY